MKINNNSIYFHKYDNNKSLTPEQIPYYQLNTYDINYNSNSVKKYYTYDEIIQLLTENKIDTHGVRIDCYPRMRQWKYTARWHKLSW